MLHSNLCKEKTSFIHNTYDVLTPLLLLQHLCIVDLWGEVAKETINFVKAQLYSCYQYIGSAFHIESLGVLAPATPFQQVITNVFMRSECLGPLL